MELAYDPALPLLAKYPRERKMSVPTEICTEMFTAALLSVAKRWKRPNCPSADD